MSWLICLRFTLQDAAVVCVYLTAPVWIREEEEEEEEEEEDVSAGLIIILHTSWRPVGAGQYSLLPVLPLGRVARISASAPLMWKPVIMRTSDFSFSPVHGSIALSLSISWQSWWDRSAPLT